MAESLSSTPSITAVLQLSRTVLKYLLTATDASADRKSLIREISFTRGILITLNESLSDIGLSDETCAATIKSLEHPDGPLRTLKTILQQLATTFEDSVSAVGLKKPADSRQWPFDQKKVEDILRVIERQKSTLLLALDNDHIALSQESWNNRKVIRAPQVGQTVKEPLWRAACNNDVSMVKLLVDAGANIDTKDVRNQTPLLWAARHNNAAMIKLLLDADANIDTNDVRNQTPLWWAACNNNAAMVKLLMDAGANINTKDVRNQTPLWWAAYNDNAAMVKLLLDAGANIDTKDVKGQTPLFWAACNNNAAMVKLLLDAGANIDTKDVKGQTPLFWAACNNNAAMVKLRLDAGANIETKKSDDQKRAARNVNDDAGVDVDVDVISESGGNSKEDDDLALAKLKSTAESLTFSLPVSVSERNLQKSASPIADSNALRKAVEKFDVQAVQGLLTQAFTDVAREDFDWLHELVEIGYNYRDIANLLVDEKKESPWIFIEPPGRSHSTIMADLHQSFCVHQGGDELALSPKLIAEDKIIRHISNCPNSDLTGPDSIKREVAASCGLAGVIPVSNDRREWIGSVVFDADDSAVASVAYELHPSHTTSTIQDCLARVRTALERLVHIISWLQQNGLCCNSFTILKLLAEVGRVEAIRVPFSLISLLVEMVSRLQSTEKKRDILNSALKFAQEILDLVYGSERDGAISLDLDTENLEIAERTTVHICALATQSLCLGLLSYSNAHAGPIQPFFLSHALKRVSLLGIEMRFPSKQWLSAEVVELTCFGQMIGNAIVAFACDKKPTNSRKYDLLVSPEDLIDTWGPGRFIIDHSSTKADRLCAIEIGGGIIRPTVDNATLFHWDRGLVNYEILSTRFNSCTKIIIAATNLNRECPLDRSQSWQGCISLIENLGTCQDYWRLTEMQASYQAGQYVMLQFNNTWVKQDGITLKNRQLNAAPGTIYLPFLESFYGLQVSLCTGVARRVLVREMLADVMEAYVENRLPVPTLWRDLLHDHNILHHFREPNLGTWFQRLSPELQMLVVQIVRYVLGILGDTGYDRHNDELIIALPFPENPFRCFRISCKKHQNLWTRVLADSEVCATYAYITPDCLEETNGQSCQKASIAQWRNRAVSLDTAVCQHRSSRETQDQTVTWDLRPDILYWIGKPGTDLTAKVLRPTAPLGMRLSIARSLMPESFLRRISNLQRIPMHRIREKQQNAEINAIQVSILTA